MAKQQTSVRTRTEIKFPDRYNVILLNDDFTPMEFVIQLLIEVFNKNINESKEITINIHEKGKGIAGVYGQEIAEQKQQESTIIARHNGHPLKIIVEPI